ncbi:hypothetical protein BKM17_27460 [Pseudomonas syringae group genomosp. 3]|nr:hypothetical protein BKM17_27460 [Pseudomonas syringae group genomosp. 3]
MRIKKDSALLAGFSLMAAHTLDDFLTGDLYRISCTVYQFVREKCMKLLPEVLLVKWIKPARRIETQKLERVVLRENANWLAVVLQLM